MAQPTWDSIADWYAELVTSDSAPQRVALAAMLELLPPLEGLAILDLGCGEGLAARALAGLGARVTGIDTCECLLEHSRRQGPTQIEYLAEDAQTLAGIPDARFAGVVANLSLNDIPDLSAVLASVSRVLQPGGWLGFSIPHPCFEAPRASWHEGARLIPGYFDEGFWRSDNPHGVRRVGNYHRTLETCCETLDRHGLSIRKMREPRASRELLAAQPYRAGFPLFLVVVADAA
ncbi:MAG: class I SAM-dependent methyltransferase [Candidatus Nephthysia bennettiae]|uniref:Class I SAM-dependent methyltransferase n=1 Tax=Candidatus Nephthysia bennettiae TaxID=3127016 RepID=A0A934K5W5_9BACT|nr:class I SAM-dependent methyltransferase [Candidatus Dormibacteraeota bacterium]PZR85005.1 MAG: class I SAM-dependent methyltransferase [Candidatus Dormibacteraeota bacterium]